MKLYGLYRYHYTERGNRYSPSYYMSKQFEDLGRAGFAKVEDTIIPEDRYTKEIAPGVISMRRFAMISFDESKISETDMKDIINNVSSLNDIVLFDTIEEALQWVREYTDLVEIESGKFEVRSQEIDEITGEDIPASYLVI